MQELPGGSEVIESYKKLYVDPTAPIPLSVYNLVDHL
jgi:hypothetical protein